MKNKSPLRRLYASLVSLKPPKESSGTMPEAIKHEVSGFKSSVVVPQDDSATAERIRTLQLFDSALTPSDMAGSYGLPAWALDTARIARAKHWAEREGMLPAMQPDETAFRESTKGLNSRNMTQYGAAIERAAMQTGLPSKFDRQVIESWQDVIDVATGLAEQAEERNEPPPPPQKPPQGGEGEGDDDDDDDNDEGEGEGDEGEADKPGKPGKPRKPKLPKPGKYRKPEELPPRKPKPAVPRYLPGGGKGNKEREIPEHELQETDPWQIGKTPPPTSGASKTGHCYNLDKPDLLPMEPRRRKKGGRRRSDEVGELCQPERLGVDNLIFKDGLVRNGYRGRGTVMVDMSSSMGWNAADFAALLNVLPECSVYGYAGQSGGGRIVLLADRGKTAKLEAIERWKQAQGGGNEIDDSALRFLCRQAQPRIWVSDGGVCAMDCSTRYMVDRCNEAIAAGRIIRVLTGKEAAMAMSGQGGKVSALPDDSLRYLTR